MERLLADIRYALRMMRRAKGFTALAVITLALGIAANTAIFSVVNHVLLQPLPYKDVDRLLMIWSTRPDGDTFPVRPADFNDIARQSKSFEAFALSRDVSLAMTGRGDPENLFGYRFSANFLDVIGTQPMLGRGFTPEDDKPGAPAVTVIGYDLWQRKFGGDPKVLGTSVTLNQTSYTIVGVMPKGFDHPSNCNIWIPLALSPELWQNRQNGILRVVARLREGVTVEQASAELRNIGDSLKQALPQSNGSVSFGVQSVREMRQGGIRTPLTILLVAVAFVMLLACVNIANLLLARSAARVREMSVRAALGAPRARILRMVLTESVVLAFAGAAAGLGIAVFAVDALVALFPNNIANLNIPNVESIPIDGNVLLFTIAMALLTGLLFGIAPALHAIRTDLNSGLRSSGRGVTRSSRRVQHALVVAQFAFALVLLVCAGLLIRSFGRVQQVSYGFDTENVLAGALMLSSDRYESEQARLAFIERSVEQLRALPGVESAGATSFLPLTGWSGAVQFRVEGKPEPPPGEEPIADSRHATPDYFRAMGIPLLRGRLFTERDRDGAPLVAILNATAAKRFWGDEDPVGKRINAGTIEKPQWIEVVGIVGDIKGSGLEEETNPDLYFSLAQDPFPILGFVVRTAGDPAALVPAFRRAVWSVDPEVPFAHLKPMSEFAGHSLALRRVSTLLMGAFALLALVLAAIGIYGVLSYAVAQRTQEIGVRMALGAPRRSVFTMVLREAATVSAIGMAIGAAGAAAAARGLGSMLYGVRAGDAVTWLSLSTLLFAVALVASVMPARRATAVDPIVALREE